LKVQECLGWRSKEPNGVIEGGCAIVAPLIVRKVEGLTRVNVCAIRGRGYVSLRIIRSSEGSEACDNSEDGYHHPEGTQRTTGDGIHSLRFQAGLYIRVMHSLLERSPKMHLGISLGSRKYNMVALKVVTDFQELGAAAVIKI